MLKIVNGEKPSVSRVARRVTSSLRTGRAVRNECEGKTQMCHCIHCIEKSFAHHHIYSD